MRYLPSSQTIEVRGKVIDGRIGTGVTGITAQAEHFGNRDKEESDIAYFTICLTNKELTPFPLASGFT